MRRHSNPVPVNSAWVRNTMSLMPLGLVLLVIILCACGVLTWWFMLVPGAMAMHAMSKSAQHVGQPGMNSFQSPYFAATSLTGVPTEPPPLRIAGDAESPRIAGRVGAPPPRDGA